MGWWDPFFRFEWTGLVLRGPDLQKQESWLGSRYFMANASQICDRPMGSYGIYAKGWPMVNSSKVWRHNWGATADTYNLPSVEQSSKPSCIPSQKAFHTRATGKWCACFCTFLNSTMLHAAWKTVNSWESPHIGCPEGDACTIRTSFLILDWLSPEFNSQRTRLG